MAAIPAGNCGRLGASGLLLPKDCALADATIQLAMKAIAVFPKECIRISRLRNYKKGAFKQLIRLNGNRRNVLHA
jgi:hypothetical protein